MKKCLFILLLVLPCLIFSQTKEDVKLAIDKINIVLVKGYVQEHGKSFSAEVADWQTLYSYIKRMYPHENHKVHKTFLNLNHAKKQVLQRQNPQDFVEKLLDEYVEHDYDQKPVNKTISALAIDEKVSLNREVPSNNIQQVESETSSSIQERGVNKSKEELPKTQRENGNGWLYLIIGLLLGYLIRPLIERQLMILKKTVLQQTNEEVRQEVSTQLATTSIVDNSISKDSSTNVTPIVGGNELKVASVQTGNERWVIAYTSEIGKSHLIANPPVPCQDNHAVKSLQNGWGIAVSCDGAGSARLSHEGSKFIADEALILFESIVKKNNWIENNRLPKEQEWATLAQKALKKLRYDLDQLAKYKKVDSKDLACTIIVVVYSPIGLLTTHIGDGRAGYRNQQNFWRPIISPHKGEEANQTIFITSNPWLDENFTMSGLKVPESNVIDDIPSAFTLMSDGCESHSFEIGYFDEEKQKFIEQNNPYSKFFEPLIQTLLNMNKEGLTSDEINQKWSDFVKSGTEKLKNEPDDKTLILGVLTN